MGAIVIRTRYDESTESAEVVTIATLVRKKTWGKSAHVHAITSVISGQGLFRSLTIRSGDVTSGHVTEVTSGHAQWSDPPQI